MTPEPQTSCNKVADLLDDYRRGTLSAGERQQVEHHLEHCDACREELSFRGVLAGHLLSSLPSGQAPTALSPAVQEALQTPRHKLSQNSRKMVLVPWMFAAAVLVIFAVAFYNNRPDESFDRGSMVAVEVPRSTAESSQIIAQEQLPTAAAVQREVLLESASEAKATLPAAPQAGAPAQPLPRRELSGAQPMAAKAAVTDAADKKSKIRSFSLRTTASLSTGDVSTTESARMTTGTLSKVRGL